MIADAELTGSGIKAMSDLGEVTISFAYGPGYGSMMVTCTGQAPFEVPLSMAALDHIAATVTRTRNSATFAAFSLRRSFNSPGSSLRL